jgi:cell division protein FtsI/penicillin-binding protein 2
MTGEASENLNSKSELISTAGKTGTAQSGVFVAGKEILRTWFAGFFPADNPNYVVVVLNENGVGGNTDCAPVFRRIAEGIVGR